ncbi:hypothetical protein PVL29_018430 [Vitis rotundifolia]|uniref:Uncharacterized protein n=1 Tax=Vitis rotundifolia TaxID=103349 RepID=A0AA38Z582_VITRO|nr:hypothetical protein PVL29_018430 [Vitis rotundifolia]
MAKVSVIWVGLLLVFGLAAMGDAAYEKYKDPKHPINIRIRDLLKRMTSRENSLLSGGGSGPGIQATAEDWINMVNELQKGSLSSRLGIPMIYGIDAVHGHNNVYNATIFPHNVGLGATRDPELVKRIGAATAIEVRATGISYAFAPCIASYCEDPNIVRAMTEIIPGLQGEIPANSQKGVPYANGKDKVAACAKHFVGDGGNTNGINENNTVVDRHGLQSIHMPAYYSSIRKGVATVMVSYSSWNGKKMHANNELVTGFLKNTLQFRGFVISDWQGIDRITSPPHANYTYSVMLPFNHTKFIEILTNLVESNVIPMSRIDDAVRRILRVKFSMGLFENPLADLSFVDHLGSQAHRDLAREAVGKSLVLLKNGDDADAPLLPLPKKANKILAAGTHAHDLGHQCGGWTMTWQGLSGNNHTTEPTYAETAGDSLNLTISEPGPSTITNVCAGVKCMVVVISGRPLVIQPYLSSIHALVAAWLPGTEGQGVTDVLFGDYGFTGKLPRTWFKTVDQLPMNSGDPRYDPLFPIGFGLTTQPIVASY